MPKDYNPNALSLHDVLLLKAANVIPVVFSVWKECHRIDPILLLWPLQDVVTTTGDTASLVAVDLPIDKVQRKAKIKEAALACDAYGLLLTEQLEDSVRMILESEQGTRTWRFPIKPHGDISVLGPPSCRDNAESIGIRWTAN